MQLSHEDEEGIEVEKIDRTSRKMERGSSILSRFLSNGRVCVEGVTFVETDKEIILNVNKKIKSEFAAVVVLKNLFEVLLFTFLLGNRKLRIIATEVDCKICVGILFSYGSNWFFVLRQLFFPKQIHIFIADKLIGESRVEPAYFENYWIE